MEFRLSTDVMRNFLVRYLGLNRAVVFSLLHKSWQAGAGLLGLVLIGLYFAPEVQGFYYTFASLVALQSFVELGLYLVISNAASHEWSRLRLAADGGIDGDPQALSRLVSLGRFVFKWYAVAALLFCVLAGAGGYWFLASAHTPGIRWQGPWLLHVAFSALMLWCAPFLSLLERREQVEPVARFRLWQVMAGNGAFWVAIVAGADLWAAPVLSAVSAAICMYYLVVCRRSFFRPFFHSPALAGMNWRLEILPMQWRLAVQGVLNYFVFSLFTPVMFHYHGPVVAGQMGMSLQLVNALHAISSIWMLTKAPRFGVLIARREFALLDLEWWQAARRTIYMMLLGVLLMLSSLYLMTWLRYGLVERVLPPSALLLLAVGAVFSLAAQNFSVYLRAHKKEVLMTVGMVSGVLMGLLVWQLGAHFGPVGASASYMLVMTVVTFPMALVI